MAKILCLLYHRVHPVRDNIYNLTVSPEEFEKHMDYLKSRYAILRFEDDWTKCDRDAVIITFDDGYADNCEYALPVLERQQIPATIFVSTGNLDTQNEFWWDELGRLLTQGRNYPGSFELQDPLYHYTWDTETENERVELVRTLRWLLRMEPDSDRFKNWTVQLQEWGNLQETAGRKEHLSLNKEQLHRLDDSEYITIGAHTVNHLSLGALSKEAQEKEIGKSIRYLQEELGHSITTFSYPFGSGMDYNADTLEICRKYGIAKAATTRARLWTAEDDPYLIPRLTISNGNMDAFEKKVESTRGYGNGLYRQDRR